MEKVAQRSARFSPRLVSSALILVRLVVGGIFLSEGIQKFLFPAERGVGRFEEIGIPFPAISGYFVGVVETVCGALILLGLVTKLAAIPLIVNMTVAFFVTKFPILWGGSTDYPPPEYLGFWDFAHEARNDWALLLLSIFLLIGGPGKWALDAVLARRASQNRQGGPYGSDQAPQREE